MLTAAEATATAAAAPAAIAAMGPALHEGDVDSDDKEDVDANGAEVRIG